MREKYKNKLTQDSKDFENQLRNLLGKSFDDSQIRELLTTDENDFKEKINRKFSEKRLERNNLIGDNQASEIEKRILLQSIDINWKLHIQYLEQLRQVIGLRSYGQRDPLIEYKKEAFVLFENLLDKIKKDLIKILFNLTVVNSENEKQSNLEKTKVNPKYVGKKMSRNEPCFCGSGKKYKHCCGRF